MGRIAPHIVLPILVLLLPADATGQTSPADPLSGGKQIIDSNELLLLHADPDNAGSVARKLYDYVSFGNPAIEDSLQAQGRQTTSDGALAVAGDNAMDAAVANFNGEGVDETISMWEGAGGSIIVSMPTTALETPPNELPRLVWDTPTEYELNGPGTIGTLTDTKSAIRVIPGQFDDDESAEVLLAYNDASGRVHLETFNVEGTSLVPVADQSAVELPSSGSLSSIDRSARFDVATGDLDDDGVDEIIVATAAPATDGCNDNRGCIDAIVVVYDGKTLSELDRTTAYSPPRNQQRWLERVAVETGDFNGDGIDDIALALHIPYLNSTHEWFLQDLYWEGDVLSVDTGRRQRLDGSNSNFGYPLSLVADDIDQDGLDEVVVMGRQLYIYKSDTLSSAMTMISNHGVGTVPEEDGRRQIALADLDGASEMWYSNTDQTVHRPEIITAQGIGQNQTDSAILLRVLRYTPSQFNLDEIGSKVDELADHDGARYPVLVAGDYGDRGVRLGPPQFFRRTDIVQPLVILNAPPIHFDSFNGTPFDVSSCYDGSCGFSATYLEQTTSSFEVSTQISGDWQLGAGIEGDLGDALSDVPVAGDVVGAILDVLDIGIDFSFEASYGEGFSDLVGSSRTIKLTSRVQTSTEDAVYASVLDYDIWEYPLYVRGKFVGNMAIVLPNPQRDQWVTTNAPEASRYRPDHEFGNILSYPSDFSPTRVRRNLYQGSRYTLSSQQISWDVSQETTEFSESTESTALSLSGDIDIDTPIPSVSVNLNGDYNERTFNTHKTSVSNLQAVTVELGAINTVLEGKQANYSVTPFVYWDGSGALVVDYEVEPSIANQGDPTTWWQERYGKLPDPALDLPDRLADVKIGQPVDDEIKTRTNSIYLFPENAESGDEVSIRALVHNFSLLPTSGDLAVRFYAGDPANGGVPITGVPGNDDPILPIIEARGRAVVTTSWTVDLPDGFNSNAVRIYAVVDPDDAVGEIHEDNNVGWAPLVIGGIRTAIEPDAADVAAEPNLLQNYPNPFAPSTTITYQLPDAQRARLSVYNVLGQRIAILVDSEQTAGEHSVVLKSEGLSSGTYFYRLEAGGTRVTRTMAIVK
ncbi:MAG: T9SS type A sorting domain-containing protein [Rhodothermales bacterium]